jgi:N-acetylmuramoyl-L-alanine amidase
LSKPHKFILLFALALLVLSSTAFNTFSLQASASTKSVGTYSVNATALNVRKAASASSASLGTLKHGTKVSVSKWSGNWAYMASGKLKGYVSGTYLTKVSSSLSTDQKSSSASTASTSSLGQRIVNASSLYMRKGPGTNYSTIGILKKGAKVTVYSITNNWASISSGSTKGYASAKYLSVIKSSPSTNGGSASVPPAAPKPAEKPTPAPKPASGARIVTASYLNVRSGPDASTKAVGMLRAGNAVNVQKTTGNWAYIVFGSVKGYVSMTYLATPGKRIICIDPGHGGKDNGASGNGLREKDINLSIGLKVRTLLQNAGITVVMTRSTDTFIPLQDRVDIGEKAHADAFVSIHTNSGAPSADGIETFYNTTGSAQRGSDSVKMASFIQQRMVQEMGSTSRGTKYGDLHVLRENTLPAILVEVGFITNQKEATQKLATDKYRNLAANAIYLGILDYYNYKGQ